MTLKQAGSPLAAYVGQNLRLGEIGDSIGFCDVENSTAFVIVPMGTKFLMGGVAVKFVEIPIGTNGDTVGALKFNGGGSFELSQIELLSPLVVTSIPGRPNKLSQESTDETEGEQSFQDLVVGE
jgi:hypothetical protein